MVVFPAPFAPVSTVRCGWKDISTFEKRQNIINLILQEAIKNDKMYVKITYNGAEEQKYDRFKIEITPILSECGIKVEF